MVGKVISMQLSEEVLLGNNLRGMERGEGGGATLESKSNAAPLANFIKLPTTSSSQVSQSPPAAKSKRVVDHFYLSLVTHHYRILIQRETLQTFY